jgi:F0F1-type ATP synthase epsilon subunit
MELIILSPRHKQTQQIVWLDIETEVGNFVIQHGHAPMIINLLPESSFTFMLENGVQKAIHIRRGVVSVMRQSITIFMSDPDHG